MLSEQAYRYRLSDIAPVRFFRFSRGTLAFIGTMLMLSVPAPIITLEDFGDNGLVFNLQFWIKLQAGIQPAQIMSDLRFSILAAFAEAGIELPFPQRAVMFDQSNPIPVRVQESGKPAL